MTTPTDSNGKKPTVFLSPTLLGDDWLAVIIAFSLILLAAIGVLGKSGIPVAF